MLAWASARKTAYYNIQQRTWVMTPYFFRDRRLQEWQGGPRPGTSALPASKAALCSDPCLAPHSESLSDRPRRSECPLCSRGALEMELYLGLVAAQSGGYRQACPARYAYPAICKLSRETWYSDRSGDRRKLDAADRPQPRRDRRGRSSPSKRGVVPLATLSRARRLPCPRKGTPGPACLG